MTKEEIVNTYSMREIAGRYGLHPNKAGFVCCPFHKEKTASMKIYDRDFHCFGCGAHGDIFTFIMRLDNVTFKEAFQSLGGTYEEPTYETKLAVYKAQKRQIMREKKAANLHRQRKLNNMLISIYQRWHRQSEPFSDAWTECYNKLQYQLYLQELLDGEESKMI
jgi:DNA primase